MRDEHVAATSTAPGTVVRGVRDAVEVTWRSLVVLCGLQLAIGLAASGTLVVAIYALPIELAVAAVLGVPVGLGLARVLRGVRSELAHVLAFGLAAGVIAAGAAGALGLLSDAAVRVVVLLLVVAPGAAATAAGRWWTGWRRRHPARSAVAHPTDEEVEDARVDGGA